MKTKREQRGELSRPRHSLAFGIAFIPSPTPAPRPPRLTPPLHPQLPPSLPLGPYSVTDASIAQQCTALAVQSGNEYNQYDAPRGPRRGSVAGSQPSPSLPVLRNHYPKINSTNGPSLGTFPITLTTPLMLFAKVKAPLPFPKFLPALLVPDHGIPVSICEFNSRTVPLLQGPVRFVQEGLQPPGW